MVTFAVTDQDRGLKTINGTGTPDREDSRPSAVSAPRVAGVDRLDDAVGSHCGDPVGPRLGRSQQLLDSDGGRVTGRPAQGVVEFGEEHAAPGVGQLLSDVEVVPGQRTTQLGHLLGRDQGILGPSVPPLERGPS